jgi:apolipoprotein N-acyltransferase
MGLLHLPFVGAWLAVLPLAGMLFLVAREPSAKSAFRIGFFGWLGFWAVHLFWLPQSFSQSFGWFVWAIMPLLWVIEAFLNAAMIYLAYRLTKTKLGTLWVAALLTLLLEYIRANMGALAFPWGNLGYTLIDTPLAQLASLGGVYFLSLLMWLVAVGIAALGFFEWRILPPMLGLVLLGLVFGVTRPEVAKPTRKALLVQGNIDPLGRLARPSGKSDLEIFVELSKPKSKNTVIVYPEAALGLEQLANVGGGLTGLDFLGKPIQVPKFERLIAGVADSRQGSRLNAVAAISNGRLYGTSTKQHLVPFGEFYPLRRELAFIYDPIFGLLGLSSGFRGMELQYETRTLELDGERFGTYVCYDSVFPDVSRARVLDGAQVLVNVSNDGWFGRTWGIEQHFLMGRMRAIEVGRSVLRVGNTGITAVIDARGRVQQRAPIQQSLALEVGYGLESGQTLYVRFGDWAVGLALLLGLLVVGSSRTNEEAW